MSRLWIVCLLILGLTVLGCSEKKDEVEALEQEAATDEAAAVMDSLEKTGTATTQQQAKPIKPAEAETPPVAEEEYKPEVDYSQMTGFVVQIGSYRDYELATHMVEKFQNREYPAFLQQVEVGDQSFYRLRIGVYDNYQEAKAIGDELVDQYSITYWIDNNR